MNGAVPQSFDPAAQLRDGIREADWQMLDLWLAAVALGTNLDMTELTDITAGRRRPTRVEYDVLAATLNDHLGDLGKDHPIPPWDDVTEG